jgi:hypothetical protein
MVRIIKAGKTIRVEKGIVIYVGKDMSVKAELVEQPKIVSIDADLYSCAIFIFEEEEKWQRR